MIKDKSINIQIFGSLLKNPCILGQTDKYSLTINDFKTGFERKLFAAIYSLYEQGAKNLGIIDIDNFFKSSPSSYVIWEKEHGVDFLSDAEDLSDLDNFDYYYNKLKKINVLNSFQQIGYDISEFYIENSLDPRFNEINDKFESLSAKDIIDSIRHKINKIEQDTGLNRENKVSSANISIEQLIEELKLSPDVGPRLQGKYFNTIVRGARKGKYYIRSAASGVGKTRNMVGDACYLAYPIRYSNIKQEWEWAGGLEKVLYIATEQEIEEIQTMILAYLSGVNEDCILYGTYNQEQEDRIKKATKIMDIYSDNLKICRMSNPNISQIQFLIRQQFFENKIENVFYDYIFSNAALLNEFRDLKIRDDQALGMMSASLKDLAVELNIFIMTATQLNANAEDNSRTIKNESAIRGSRAIIDKADMACIMARPTEEELNLLSGNPGEIPNTVTDIYKMRRGRYTQVRIWSYSDLGNCRRKDLYVTTTSYKIVTINNLKQEYDEDCWEIQKLINTLNGKEAEEITEDKPQSKFTEIILETIDERKEDPFYGLI